MNFLSKPLTLLAVTVAQSINGSPVGESFSKTLMKTENVVYVEPLWFLEENRRIRRTIPEKNHVGIEDIKKKLDDAAKEHPKTHYAYHAGFNGAKAILLSEIKKLYFKLEAAKEFEIKLTPRLLIDTIEGKFNDDFKRAKDTMPEDLRNAEGALTEANKTIETLKGKIEEDRNGPQVETFQQTIDHNTRLLPELEKKISEFKFYLNNIPSDPTQERIERRNRKWHWFLRHKSEDADIKKIQTRIEFDYNKQLENESSPVGSLQEFEDKFCYALARAHEEGSVVVHAIKKIEADVEFKIIHFFDDDDLDPYLTTFVNAVGLRKRKQGPRFEIKKKNN